MRPAVERLEGIREGVESKAERSDEDLDPGEAFCPEPILVEDLLRRGRAGSVSVRPPSPALVDLDAALGQSGRKFQFFGRPNTFAGRCR
jgi:hypothetical protein